MDIDITQIEITQIVGYAVLSIVGLVFTNYILPLVAKVKKLVNNKYVESFIDSAVRAAEQIYGSKTGELKKSYVKDKVMGNFGKKLSEKDIDSYIEAAVYNVSNKLKNEKKELKANPTLFTVTKDNITKVNLENDKTLKDNSRPTKIKMN